MLVPYETSQTYEEEIVDEFENQCEAEFCNYFLASIAENALNLDLACGNGRHTLRLSEKANHVVALDLSPNKLKMAKKKYHDVKNINFIEGSMFELPFKENTFDGIWFSHGFEFVPPDKREMLLSSLNSILKSTGIFYLSAQAWISPSIWDSLKRFGRVLGLFCYWRFLKRKPLLWGEGLYYLSPKVAENQCSCWDYHVYTDKSTLLELFPRCGFALLKLDVQNGYIYTSCRKTN